MNNKLQELLHLCQIENNTTLSSIKKTASQLPWWDNSDASKELTIKTFVIQNDIPCTPYYINQNDGYGIAVLNCTTEKTFIPRIINWINQIATNLDNVKIYNVFSGVVPTIQDLIDSNIYCLIGTGGNYNGRSTHASIMAYKAFLHDLHLYNKTNEKVIHMFAICASHQILAESLGGNTIENDKFEYALKSDYPTIRVNEHWRRIGLHSTELNGEKMLFAQYHINQINELSHDEVITANTIGHNNFCLNDVVEYRKNDKLLYFSMQGHPEKTPDFCLDELIKYKEKHDLNDKLKTFIPENQDYGVMIGVKIFKEFSTY